MNLLDQGVTLGSVGLRLGVLLFLLAFLASLGLAWWLDRRAGSGAADRIFGLMLAWVVGARLLFVVQYHQDVETILDVIDIRDGAYAPLGGFLGGGMYLLWTLIRRPVGRGILLKATAGGLLAWGVLFVGAGQVMGEVDRNIPDITVRTLDGEALSLAETADDGRPLVVNIWATWCPPCLREMPMLERAQQENPDVRFVFLNYREETELISGYLARHGLDLDQVVIDTEGAISEALDFVVLPTTLYYNADGILVDGHAGELRRAGLQRSLERLTVPR